MFASLKLFLIKDSFLRNCLLDYNIHKEIYLNFFKKNNIKIFISSSMSQNYIVCANAAAKILKLHIVGFTCSLNTYYSNDLGIYWNVSESSLNVVTFYISSFIGANSVIYTPF